DGSECDISNTCVCAGSIHKNFSSVAAATSNQSVLNSSFGTNINNNSSQATVISTTSIPTTHTHTDIRSFISSSSSPSPYSTEPTTRLQSSQQHNHHVPKAIASQSSACTCFTTAATTTVGSESDTHRS